MFLASRIAPRPFLSSLACAARRTPLVARRALDTRLTSFRTLLTMASPTVKLSSGHEMPLVGFGLWKVDNAVCADTVYNAIKAGYRLLDGACGTCFL